MFTWLAMYDSRNTKSRKIVFFHDFLLVILLYTLIFVGLMLVFVWSKPIITKSYKEANFLELVWTIIPILILIVIFVPSLLILNFNLKNKSILYEKIVKVIGHQWNWEYEYNLKEENLSYVSTPEVSNSNRLLESSDYLVIDSKVKTLIKVTSDDVIHRFRLPSLGIKIDAVPGRINEVVLGKYLNLFGVHKGQCSEICGVYHSNMPIMVVCLPLS